MPAGRCRWRRGPCWPRPAAGQRWTTSVAKRLWSARRVSWMSTWA